MSHLLIILFIVWFVNKKLSFISRFVFLLFCVSDVVVTLFTHCTLRIWSTYYNKTMYYLHYVYQERERHIHSSLYNKNMYLIFYLLWNGKVRVSCQEPWRRFQSKADAQIESGSLVFSGTTNSWLHVTLAIFISTVC